MSTRRSFVLVTVLVIVTIVLLIVTSTIFLAQAEMAGAAAAQEAARGRRLAWSGLQAVMTRLETQRDRILTGAMPTIEDEFVLYESRGRGGVVRLVPIGLDGIHLVSESGKLDLNRVDADMLVATGLVEGVTADAIIEDRTGRRGGAFQSIAELLSVAGVTPEKLYGPLDDLETQHDAAIAPAQGGDALRTRTPRGLADILTVFSHEPALQRSGVKRINLNVQWSETLGGRLDKRFGAGAGQVVKSIMNNGTQFDTEERIYDVLNFFKTPVEDWPDIIDTLTADTGSFHVGRLDLNTASTEAIAVLPGLDREMATQIVRRRDAITDDRRSTVAWPALEDIVPVEAYPSMASWITTRCFLYRIRLVAGEIDLDDPEARIVRPIALEAVIDLAEPRARLAYLRDVTVFPTTVGLLAAQPQLMRERRSQRSPRELEASPDASEAVEDNDLDISGGFGNSDPLEFGDLSMTGTQDREAGDMPPRIGSDMRPPPPAGPRRRIGRWLAGPAKRGSAPELR